MVDVLMVAGVLAFFALSARFVDACSSLLPEARR